MSIEIIIFLNGIVGFATPYFTAFLVKQSWAGWVKGSVAFGFCLASTTISLASTNKLDFSNFQVGLLTILAVHQLSYQMFSKDFAQPLQSKIGFTDKVKEKII